jgi:uncharacterized protein YgiM (DUF1202 family)
MCWRYLAMAVLGATSVASRGWCSEFPYTAYVSSADVYVRSGPGKNYYPTDKLKKGEKVEVYRHDPGGWYAIRPPRSSFSWVATRYLDPLPDQIAKVNSDRVTAGVGSAFSDVRDVKLVRLDKGEKVEILETLGPWSKIAPPSGEFRWISGSLLNRQRPEEFSADEDDPAGRGERQARREVKSNAEGVDEEDVSPAPRDAWQTKQPIRLTSGQQQLERAAPAAAPPDSLQKTLDAIDLELSAMVAEEVTVWSFGDLRRRAEAAIDGAPTALGRGRARLLLSKIARFEDIKQRRDTILSAQQETDARNRQLGPDAIGPDGLGRRVLSDASRFDGVGRLMPVGTRKVGAPQFALVDAAGAVVVYLTPAPGVNLQAYRGKQIGVSGPRNFMADLQKQHINVQRVTELDVPRR